MKKPPDRKNSLAFRLLRVVFSIYLCITVLITLMQMTNEYLLEERFVKSSLIDSQNISQTNLETAIWNFDQQQLVATVEGLLKQPNIIGIQIFDEKQKPLMQQGQILNQEQKPVLLENDKQQFLPYVKLYPHSFDLLHEQKKIGTAIFYTSNEVVFNKVKLNFVVILINAIIKTIALWWLFLWAFNKFLTRQLDIFCAAMEGVDIDTQKNCFLNLETFNSYELCRIEYFFNHLLQRVIESRLKLSELNKTLEQKVIERTQQLVEKQNALEKMNAELQQHVKMIEQISITDELTQLYNRRYFNSIFAKEIQRAARENLTISFLICDVDFFKSYNDNYGHQKGDQVLEKIGQILKSCCQRGCDIPLRLGGEEFGVIFSGTTEAEAFNFAEKIRLAILDRHIEHNYSSVGKYISASFGLVTLAASPNLTMDMLYKQADELLYQAKYNGRNQIACYKFTSYSVIS